ncbi:hypothetical protein C8R44DRAFT_895116 [Mycena epipterygia]|nr:hypothetical protein C8R44DRAFT_895116 [Mycena epipterygia]
MSSPYCCLFEKNDPIPDCDVLRLRSILSERRLARPSSIIAPRVNSMVLIRLVSGPKYSTSMLCGRHPQITCCGLFTCEAINQRASDFARPFLLRLLRLALYDTEFLHLLEIPVLEELVVFEHVAPVISFLRRSTCPLKRLLCFTCSDPTSIIGILEITPTIVELCVPVAALQPHDLDLIARLASDDPAFAFNPAVISLDVEFGHNDTVLFLDVVEFR